MDDLLRAILAWAQSNAVLNAKFGQRIVIIDNPNILTVESMATAFPLLGIRDGGMNPAQEVSEQTDETADVEFYIYQQRLKSMYDSMVGPSGIVTLGTIVRKQFDHMNDFSAQGYAGPYVIDAQWQNTFRSEPFTTPDIPNGMRQLIVIKYLRETP